jgi:multiple sugar transport system substrate-binding protein
MLTHATAQARRSKRTALWIGKLLLGAVLALPPAAASAERLVIDFIISTGTQRTAWFHIVNRFSAANPDIEVVHNALAQEEYKRNFTDRLQNGKADLAFWYAGERLHEAARGKLLVPLEGGQVELLLRKKFAPTTLDATRIDGEVYGFPLFYYGWGLTYRKSLFKRLGIRPPATWSEFHDVCKRLKGAGVTPLAIGAKFGWPAAGWFDYLNLRLNGIDFHRKLLRGEEQFDDPRVRKVFDAWGELLRSGYFLDATMDHDWDQILPYLYRNQVGMMLIGSFVGAKVPAALAPDMGFFPFPRMSADMPMYEEAPIDVLVQPASGENPKARKRFLAFLAEHGAMAGLHETNQTISPQGDSTAPPGSLRDASHAILKDAAGLTFFFDRDAKAALVQPAFDAMRQFLRAPHDSDQAMRAIEHALRRARTAQGGKPR